MKYVKARYNSQKREVLYKSYVTNGLKAIVESKGYTVEESWFDEAYGTEFTIEDERAKAIEAFSRG